MNLVVMVTPIFYNTEITEKVYIEELASSSINSMEGHLIIALQNALANILATVDMETLPSKPLITSTSTLHGLSPREAEVLVLIAKGLTQKEIGRALNLSPATIGGYKKEIYRKLAISSTAEATLEAIKHNLVNIDAL